MEYALRIELWGDKIENIAEIDPLTGKVLRKKEKIDIYPAKHFVTTKDKLGVALHLIED